MIDKIRLCMAQLNPIGGDIEGNMALLLEAYERAKNNNADILLAPEMFISGYPIDDLVLRPEFIHSTEKAILKIAKNTKDGGPAIIVGAPRNDNGFLRNSVFVLDKGEIIGFRDKAKLPNEDEFYDNRQFVPGELPGPISIRGIRIGLPICQDLWVDSEVCECLTESGAELIFAINGSTYEFNKMEQRLNTVVSRVTENHIPIIYLNMVGGQDELIFDGGSFAINSNGNLACQLPMFKSYETTVDIEKTKKGWELISSEMVKDLNGMEALYTAITLSIRDYVSKNGFSNVILGLSGGVDSALVASMSVDALGSEKVKSFMLPTAFTSETSELDAKEIAERLNISLETIKIQNIFDETKGLLLKIFEGQKSGTAEENIQSRLRALLLMAISNKFGSMLLSTSNKSESAVGYTTLYGDMSGGFSPLKDVWKSDVFALCEWRNKNIPSISKYSILDLIPLNIIQKPPSAELRNDQKDTDTLPEYSRLDKILSLSIEKMKSNNEIVEAGFDKNEVNHVLKLLKNSEYKRFQSPPGPKLGKKAFGRDRMYPLTNKFYTKI